MLGKQLPTQSQLVVSAIAFVLHVPYANQNIDSERLHRCCVQICCPFLSRKHLAFPQSRYHRLFVPSQSNGATPLSVKRNKLRSRPLDTAVLQPQTLRPQNRRPLVNIQEMHRSLLSKNCLVMRKHLQVERVTFRMAGDFVCQGVATKVYSGLRTCFLYIAFLRFVVKHFEWQ